MDDTITVMAGVYTEGQINIGKSLSLSANGTVVVDGLGDSHVFNVSAHSVTISGFYVTNGSHSGIFLTMNYGLIQNNRVENCQGGIVLFGSYFSLIENNTLYDNHQGIELSHSSYNTVKRNKLTGHSLAILLGYSYSNLLEANIIAGNGMGFWLQNSNDDSIVQNNVSDNSLGIWLFPNSDHNNIFHNNFLENSNHVTVSSDSMNTWDDSYPSGGNYWSNYSGVDLFSGSCQNETGSDGIGDTQYVIDENNRDNYPLMKPWSPAIAATIDVDPDTLNLKSKGRWITCYIELPEGYDVSDIDRATMLLNGTISVDPFWVDKPLESVIGDYDNDTVPDLMVKFNRAAVIEYLLNQNKTHGNITLTVTGELYDCTPFEGSDTIVVKIPGKDIAKIPNDRNSHDEYSLVMPEFPSFLILPLFMIATLLAVTVYRRKHTV